MLGENLRKARHSKGATQQMLANQIQFKRQSISDFEIGKAKPGVKTLIKISKALECKVEELIKE